MKFKFSALVLILLASAMAFEATAQTPSNTALLESRHRDDATGVDNYSAATFSFSAGGNGPDIQKLTRNNWDIQFSSQTYGEIKKDFFDVSMVVDDRSRIIDLGELDWNELGQLPDLPAYEKPTREKPVPATVGHIYYVHSADRDSDHYALFRVEDIRNGESVTLSWKLVGTPSENSK